MEFDLSISHCFLEEELLNGIDLKNIGHLKKMARVLVEERAIIKRVGAKEQTGDNANNLYTVDINLSHITPINPDQSSPRSE